jgi:hypothetical protein
MKLSHLKTAGCAGLLAAASALSLQAQANHFNTRGNILISDRYNNRVLEVNPNNHRVVWQFGNGLSVTRPRSKSDAPPFSQLTRGWGIGVYGLSA